LDTIIRSITETATALFISKRQNAVIVIENGCYVLYKLCP